MLKTSVPDKRPTRTIVGLHGELELYAALSPEHQTRGDQLRALRCDLNLTLRDAARLTGLTPVDFSECERGVRDFDFSEAEALLRKSTVKLEPAR